MPASSPLLSPDTLAHPVAVRDDAKGALLERFITALTLVGGTAQIAATMGEAVGAVREVLAEVSPARAGRFVAWDDETLKPVVEAMIAAGWTRVEQALPAAGDVRAARTRDVASCEVGVTSAVAALADTGSLVLASSEGSGRLASLLPPVHIAILPVSRMHASLARWLERLDAASLPANVVVVTGPSRTADIEQTLSRGVHGPKAVHVIVVPA